MSRLEYRIKQGGMVVASAEGPRADAEIAHYAAVYGQDGPLTIEQRVAGEWREVPRG